jgi:DNA-binding PadR family transcriptional regulator
MRERVYKVLLKYPGSSRNEIVEKAGINPTAGSLFVILASEVSAKRISRTTDGKGAGYVYSLSAAGKAAMESGKLDELASASRNAFLRKKGWAKATKKMAKKAKAKKSAKPKPETAATAVVE